jgi:hypothetical protein
MRYAPTWPAWASWVTAARAGPPALGLAIGPAVGRGEVGPGPGAGAGAGAGVRRPVTHEGIRANTPGEGDRPEGG